jgi:hypothetical protein
MTIVFDPQNAAITTDVLGSEAILSITPVFAILNLKRNNGLILKGTDNKQPSAASSAVKIVGTVFPSVNDGDNLNNWDIRFIQLNALHGFYSFVEVLLTGIPTSWYGTE